MPLVNKSINMSLLIPLSSFAVMTWLAIVVLGAIVGGSLILLYEYWAVKKGYSAWIVLTGKNGEVTTPAFRELWWFLISIIILIGGLSIRIILQK
jgi:hypothetical protein